MSNKVVPNVRTHGRFDILGFLDDSLDSGGSGDEVNKQPKPKEEKGKASNSGGGQSSSAGAKKRSKKKKKQQAENAELRNMAFTKIATVPGGRTRTQSNSSTDGVNTAGLSGFQSGAPLDSSVAQQRPLPSQVGGATTLGMPAMGKGGRKPEQWEQWKVADQGYVSNQYEKDLQKAILQSKLEFEQQKLFFGEAGITPDNFQRSPVQSPPSPQKQQQPPQQLSYLPPAQASLYQKMDQLEDFDTMTEPEPPTPPPPSTTTTATHNPPGLNKKEKKKHSQGKHKAHAMSLQEFQTGGENGVVDGGASSGSQPKKSPGISEEDKHFFDKVDEDVASILNKDHIKKARKQNEKFVAENARRVQYEDQLEKKDKVIGGLKDIVEKLKAELTQVKKRNKQLCFILAQGEMKDKAEVLKQVEELTSDKDDLTSEVAELHGSLEQERSKVHSLKSELQKLQDRKK